MQRWSVEFSSALYNRTGKFFIGRDIIADQADLIAHVYYWRLALQAPPTGMPAKLIGRAINIEQAAHATRIGALVPRFHPRERLLHLDPFTVLHTALHPEDAVLCHDLGPITHPDLFSADVATLYAKAYARIASHGCRMVFVSKASADAYAAHYGVPRDGRVIYPPLRTDLETMPTAAVEGVTAPFLLTVGSIGRRKNQEQTIAAYARSGLWDRGVGYVLCGAREPGSEAVEAIARSTPGVTLLSYVSDAELAWLYDRASGFVLLSLLEGFGVPVAEAIARGMVPLVSKDSVLCEVAGDGALVADPGDPDDMALAMTSLASLAPSERDDRRALLRESIRRFTPDRFRADWRQMMSEPA